MRLDQFTGAGYDKGRSPLWQALWWIVQNTIFVKWWLPRRCRPSILRAFGAEIGDGVVIRPHVRVHWPWKLKIGAHSWIGEGAWLLNLEQISIGTDACVSQDAFICTGSHDRRSPTFEFDNAPITLGDSSWIAARAMVLRGVAVGDGAVVAAGEVASRDVPAGCMWSGGQARESRP